MRTTFIKTLLQSAAQDERFIQQFPRRFINVGVAEQNMLGMAGGLALTGRKVVCYSIGNFTTLRCYEQIRNDVCYHNGDVKVVSVGGGLAYGSQGYTHHAVEDLSVMRALPNMTVLAPGDPVEVGFVTRWMMEHNGPCYLRLGKAGENVLHDSSIQLTAGKMIEMRRGADLLIIATGGIVQTALQVADQLALVGIAATVTSCPYVKPLDEAYVTEQSVRYPWLVTLEEHTRFGGVGEAIGYVLSMLPQPVARLLPFSVPELALKGIGGTQQELLQRIGLDAISIAAAIQQKISPVPMSRS
jgi:transketolase